MMIDSCNLCFFMRESSYCFQRVLAITILSVRLSVTLNEGAKWDGGGQNLWFLANNSLYLSNGARQGLGYY